MRPALHAAALALAAACGAPAQREDVLAPDGVESVFEYLGAKYDADGDGAIAPHEYRRAGADFAELDADGDGVLTPADFPDEDFAGTMGIGDIPPEVRARLRALYDARAVVLTYLQPDPGAEGLSLTALDAGLQRLDLDADGALAPEELARATQARPWAGPGTAWDLLAAAADKDGDARLSRVELYEYHAALDGDDGLLRGPPSGWSALGAGPASDGPPVGSPAPDFALAPPEGGRAVRLSAWRGRKPVALIFGSYT